MDAVRQTTSLFEPSTGRAATAPSVRLLGAFDARVDSQELQPPPYRVQALLAALLLYPRPWRRETLSALLYPDASESRGRKRLSHVLWQARQWLSPLPVEAGAEILFLPPDAVWLDVRAFNESAARQDLNAWLAALELYRGELLSGLYEDWLLEEREAFYLRYVRLSHRVCDTLWQQNDIDRLLPVVERLVQLEPLDERALRTLMRAYRSVGRRGAALAAYDRCATLARDQIGTELGPATQALADAIRTDPAAFRSVREPFGFAASDQRCASSPLPSAEGGTEGGSLVGGGNDAAVLLKEARAAILRGDADRVGVCVAALRTHRACANPQGFAAAALRLLEIDLALAFEDYTEAGHLLDSAASATGSTSVEPGEVQLRRSRLALGLHDGKTALRLAADVLMAADASGECDKEGHIREIEALLVLGGAQQMLGETGLAALSYERARLVSRSIGYHHGVARARIGEGRTRITQGRYHGAGSCFREARAVALEHDLRLDLAASLRGLGLVLSHTNALGEALRIAKEELSLWRDLRMQGREAEALQGLALVQNHLGRSAESLRTLAQAQDLCDRLGDRVGDGAGHRGQARDVACDPVPAAHNRYHVACAMVYHDDAMAEQAAEVAQTALETFREHHQTAWEARTLEIIGYARWVARQHALALQALQGAEAITRRLGELAYLPELLAYQGCAYVGLDQPREALSLTQQALVLLAQGGVSDEVVPEILYAHAMALTADGRGNEADPYLQRAYRLLLEGAATFDEDEAREAFFQRNPTMRHLMAELQTRGIAPPRSAVVRSVVLTPAGGGAPRRIVWTIDAGPADAALGHAEGAVSLRRARLARLLGEAQAQGGAPTVVDLAQALDVSTRTIQRDLAALRT